MVPPMPPVEAVSPAGEHFLVTEEEFRAVAYNRDGHWTAGFGTTGLLLDGTPIGPHTTVTRSEAELLLRDRLAPYTYEILRVASRGGIQLLQHELDALASLVYNTGPGILTADHSLGRALLAADRGAIASAILLYENATIDGVHGPFLRARRHREHDVFTGARRLPSPDEEIACVIPRTEQVAETD